MTAHLRSLWVSINASYWFYPTLFSLIAAALALTTVWLDRSGAAEFLTDVEWLVPARPEGARTVLSVIAGSMIGVAATVFSITIAAVAYASGNYGPRLLTNFMQDKPNQLSLGVFISVFVYALLVLRVVRNEAETAVDALDAAATPLPGFTPQLSLLVATGLAMLAVATLVYFLHHIPASIRINSVLHGIGSRLVHDIVERFPEDADPEQPGEAKQGTPIVATAPGFITIIDFATLDEIAEKHEAVVILKVRTGDFVHPDVTLIEVSGCDPDDDLTAKLRTCFETGSIRTAVQDPEFLFDELVEIALRALSPGINDPFTAITSLQWIGAATAELGRRNLDCGPEQQSYSRERVRPLDDDFTHFVQRGFGGVRASAAASALASKHFIDALAHAATTCKANDRLALLRAEGDRLLAQARLDIHGPSLEELEHRHANFTDYMRGLES